MVLANYRINRLFARHDRRNAERYFSGIRAKHLPSRDRGSL
jgi:hypothetical protein